jgi:hypothetical protein
MAGDGLASDASVSGDHPSNPKRGCDVVQGCRVDREEDDRQKDDSEEDDSEKDNSKEDNSKEDNREEDDGKEDNREEDHGEKVGRQAAGCRFEPVAEGRAA